MERPEVLEVALETEQKPKLRDKPQIIEAIRKRMKGWGEKEGLWVGDELIEASIRDMEANYSKAQLLAMHELLGMDEIKAAILTSAQTPPLKPLNQQLIEFTKSDPSWSGKPSFEALTEKHQQRLEVSVQRRQQRKPQVQVIPDPPPTDFSPSNQLQFDPADIFYRQTDTSLKMRLSKMEKAKVAGSSLLTGGMGGVPMYAYLRNKKLNQKFKVGQGLKDSVAIDPNMSFGELMSVQKDEIDMGAQMTKDMDENFDRIQNILIEAIRNEKPDYEELLADKEDYKAEKSIHKALYKNMQKLMYDQGLIVKGEEPIGNQVQQFIEKNKEKLDELAREASVQSWVKGIDNIPFEIKTATRSHLLNEAALFKGWSMEGDGNKFQLSVNNQPRITIEHTPKQDGKGSIKHSFNANPPNDKDIAMMVHQARRQAQRTGNLEITVNHTNPEVAFKLYQQSILSGLKPSLTDATAQAIREHDGGKYAGRLEALQTLLDDPNSLKQVQMMLKEDMEQRAQKRLSVTEDTTPELSQKQGQTMHGYTQHQQNLEVQTQNQPDTPESSPRSDTPQEEEGGGPPRPPRVD